jgi:SAM-dependent methyltransferase
MHRNYISSTSDQHVFTIQPFGGFHSLLEPVGNFDDLCRLILMLSPSALEVAIPSSSSELPTDKLLRSIGGIDNIDPKLPLHDAIGSFILNRRPPGLELLANIPPSGVHAMQRGPYWVGDIYSADLIVGCLSEVGLSIQGKVLDYGCSSGSMLRVLASVYPEVEFVGSDPVQTSIEWAQNNLPMDNLSFAYQEQVPPLPFECDEMDLVCAISIWSHHGFNASKRWFDEIHRILKPGGICAFTAHGIGSILYYTQLGQKPLGRFKEIYASYLSCGFAFEEVWVTTDDVGNQATSLDWGNSYFDPKVIAMLLDGKFEILSIKRRANQINQDVYVIRKSP